MKWTYHTIEESRHTVYAVDINFDVYFLEKWTALLTKHTNTCINGFDERRLHAGYCMRLYIAENQRYLC